MILDVASCSASLATSSNSKDTQYRYILIRRFHRNLDLMVVALKDLRSRQFAGNKLVNVTRI